MIIGQCLRGDNMGPIKFKMAEIMRMRKILMLITYVRVKIKNDHWTVFESSNIGQTFYIHNKLKNLFHLSSFS